MKEKLQTQTRDREKQLKPKEVNLASTKNCYNFLSGKIAK